MAKKRTYEAEIKVKDSFSSLLDKLVKQLDTVDKKIDEINKNKISVKAEVDSSFKNVSKRIEKEIPNDKKIKVSATQDISRELDKANRDIFEMNRKLNSNLNNAFKTMASNANKAVKQINSATSGLTSSNIKMSSSASNGLSNPTLGVGKGSGLSNALLGGNLAASLMGNKNKATVNQTSDALEKEEKETKKNGTKVAKAVDKMYDDINTKASKFKFPSIKFPKISMPSNPFKDFGARVDSHRVMNELAPPDDFTPKGLPNLYKGDNKIIIKVQDEASKAVAFIQQKFHDIKKLGQSPVMLALKDVASNTLDRIKNKFYELNGKIYYAKVAVQDKASSIIDKVKNKYHQIRGKAFLSVVSANDKATKVIEKVKSGLKFFVKHPFKATVVAVDKASQIIKKISSKIKEIANSKAAKVVISAVDKASSVIKGVASKVAGLTKAAAAIVIGGAGLAFKEGMTLEKQEVSMQHFMDKLNPGGDTNAYIDQLRGWANATPFETGEIMGVGARALQVSEGDTEKSMQLVKMASDMAA